MEIGVVVVTYNRIEKLKHSLACYSKQSLSPKYVLVINNCSTDGTKEYLERWKNESEIYQKKVIHLSENTGGAGGFYVGMEAALQFNAEWIWLADDDAYPRENALEVLNNAYEELSENEKETIVAVCSAVYNNGVPHTGHRNRLKKTFFRIILEQTEPYEYEKTMFEFDILSYVGACIKKSALIKAGLDEKEYFIYRDDQEHSIRLNKIGKFVCFPQSIVDHDTPPFDKRQINWGKYYFIRNDLLMIRKHFPYRYFIFRFLKRYFADASLFSKNDSIVKKIYHSAYIDALHNRTGLSPIYRPGWKPEDV